MSDIIIPPKPTVIPHPSAPVWPLQRDMVAFYGNPYEAGWLHANTVEVPCPWPLHMGSTALSQILIHKRCAESLARVLAKTWEDCGKDVAKIHALRYDVYDGSYALRPIRGGTTPSCHAFAAAIDWDAADNQQHALRHLFTDSSPLVVNFKAEGAVWGGDWGARDVDAMHFQFARVHG